MTTHSRQVILVTGPAKSGKSEWAEYLAGTSKKEIIYIATAQVASHDSEWYNRIQNHQKRRPKHWQTWEVPLDLVSSLQTTTEHHCLLIDSLGTWIANHLSETEENWAEIARNFQENLQQSPSDVILVAEETGWGVVPAYPVGRLFRDRLGKLTRHLGKIADCVYLVTGGHVLNLSILGHPLPFD